MTLEARFPIGENASIGQQQNEHFIGKLINDLNLFIKKYDYNNDPADKENRVVEFQRENLLDSASNRVITRTVIHFPNDSVLLGQVLNHLTNETATRQGQPLYQVVRPTRQQKDFNEVLQQRNGQLLPASHNLRIGEPPRIVPFQKAGESVSQPQPQQGASSSEQQKTTGTNKPSESENISVKRGQSKPM